MENLCGYFMEGTCNSGPNCRYIHDRNFCKFLYFNGHCRKGDRCQFNHTVNQSQGPPRKKPKNNNKRNRRPKNTESFIPSHEPSDMRVVFGDPNQPKYSTTRQHTSRDVIIVPGLFCEESDWTIYNKLLDEIKSTNLEDKGLWKLWHGDSHLIADDHLNWKKDCPTFKLILDKVRDYFDMDIKATRFNWYRDSTDWKPFHHDAAAVKKDKARTQNFTVGISFGAERDAAFQHSSVNTKKTPNDASVISFPLPNGSIYAFSQDVNVEWKHGILQKVDPNQETEVQQQSKEIVRDTEGRISIIAWGWVDQE